MKKTYMIPTLMVVKIKTSGMIATSPTAQPQDEGAITPGMGRESDWDEDEY